MITKRILPIYSLYDVSKAAFAVRENAELRCIRPSMAVKKLNLDTFISTLDQVYSAETLHEKEKHFHRLTSVYGHIPTDDLIFHMLEANASQNSVDRVVSLLSLLKNEGRGPLARSTMQGIVNCLIFLRSVLAAQVEADDVCLFHHFHNEGIREKQTVEYSNNTCTHATNNNNNNNNALDETTSMCFHREGTVSTLPGLTNQVRSLWKDAIHLAQDATSILTVCLEAVRCLSIAGDTAGLNQICFDYIPSSCESHRVGGMGAFTTFSCADELLAAALYGYRKAADLFAIHELCKKYAILPKHSSFKDTSTAPLPPLTFPKAALYYTEALLALGDFAEATQTLQILQEFPLYTESDTGALTLEDLVHQHTVLKTKTWEESLALMTTTKENTKERYKMATIQDDILDRRLAMIVSSTFELIEARRDNLDNSIVIQIIHHINTVTERGNMMGVAGPETTHALFSSLEHLLYDAVSPCTKDVVDQKEVEERVRKALERFKSSRYSTSSGNATFCTETPRCVNAVLSLLLRLCDMEAMEVYVRTLTERDTVSYIRGELYRDIWKLARAEGHGTFACMLRVHRKLIVP